MAVTLPPAFEYVGSPVPAVGGMVVSVNPWGVERCPSTAGPGRACRCVGGSPVPYRAPAAPCPRRGAAIGSVVRWFGGSFSDNKNNVFVIVRWVYVVVWYWSFLVSPWHDPEDSR